MDYPRPITSPTRAIAPNELLPIRPKQPQVRGEKYPRPIESIHQIELSSRCNLRCVYCPSRHLDKPIAEGGSGRAKEDITPANFRRALEWAVHFERRGTQGELALTGIGEALLHPDFVDFVRLAREALPTNRITFSTNGLDLTEELCERLKPYKPEVYVSLHRPEKAGNAVDYARDAGILAGVNVSAATERFDWAGQLPIRSTAAPITCEFLRSGWCVVLADGRIATCCLDASGHSVVGHVDDAIGSLSIQPWKGEGPLGETGCSRCHMEIP